jgi:chemotaxis protein CheX
MNVKYINPFLTAVNNVIMNLGGEWVKKGNIKVKKDMSINKEVTAFVGVVGNVRGNISYSFSAKTALGIASMMIGMEIDKVDEIARSAIAELSNMITGNALAILADSGELIDITTPTVVMGKDMYCVLCSVDTIMVEIETQYGFIELDFGFEM